MHRSGTSFLARALNLTGVNLGSSQSLMSTEWDNLPDNEKGHWENKFLSELADISLAYNDGTWDNIPNNITIDEKIGNKISIEISKILNDLALSDGMKDPRLLLLLDSWKPYLPKNLVYVGIFRHPLKVAQSLKKRNGFAYEKSIHLWKQYNEKLLKLSENSDVFLFNFDWDQSKIFSEFKLLCDKLGLFPIDISKWYSKDVLHYDASLDSNYKLDSETLEIHNKLEELTLKNHDVVFNKVSLELNDIPKIVSNFTQSQQESGEYFKQIFEKLKKEIDDQKSYTEKIIQDKDKIISGLESSIKEQKSYTEKVIEDYKNQINLIRQNKIMILIRFFDKIRGKH